VTNSQETALMDLPATMAERFQAAMKREFAGRYEGLGAHVIRPAMGEADGNLRLCDSDNLAPRNFFCIIKSSYRFMSSYSPKIPT
jgi:hypothetical protein